MSYKLIYIGKKKKNDEGINFKLKRNAVAFKRRVFNNSNKFKIVKK
jgi:hypothetical protein